MTKYYISTISRWNNVASKSLSSGDLVEINANITFINQPTVMVIPSDVVLDGRNHLITLDYSGSITGFMSIQGGTIRNVKIHGGDNTLDVNEGTLIKYNSTNDSNYGTITNCSITNITSGSSGGCLLPNNFGHSSNQSTVSKCRVINSTINNGGICGNGADNIIFEYCYCKSNTFSSSSYIGGICSRLASSCTFNDCYCSADLGSSYNGGILGLSLNDSVNVILNRCYFVGTITANYQGGLVGRIAGSSSQVDINNCYTNITSISATYAGGFIGSNEITTTNITNSYSTNNSHGAFIGINSATLTLTLTNTYKNGTDDIDTNSGSITIAGSNQNNSLTDITGLIDSNWLDSIWSSVSSDQPILISFEDNEIWDDTYVAKDDAPDFSNFLLNILPTTSCLAGDTMILTTKGYIRIDKLSSGDSVITSTGRKADIKNIGKFESNKNIYKIKTGAFGKGLPLNDTIISGNHKIYLHNVGWTMPKKIFKTIYKTELPVLLYHIRLHNHRQHEGLIANGLLVDTWK